MNPSQITIAFDPVLGVTFQATETNPMVILGILDVVHAQLIKKLTESRITPATTVPSIVR